MTITRGNRKAGLLAIALLMVAALLALPGASPNALAVPPASGTVFDNFDDGDVSDWIPFGGNAAGGGGGADSDRPKAGSHYYGTGWGGNGTASGFYGGTFKNLPDASQVKTHSSIDRKKQTAKNHR